MLCVAIVFFISFANTEAVKVILRHPNGTGNNNDTRIVGGHQIAIEQAPWQVALFYENEFACGGSVLSNRFILTAAHCVKGYRVGRFKIRAGSSSLQYGGQVRKVSKIVYDDSYNAKSNYNDIAVMKLRAPLKLDQSVRSVKIAFDYQPLSGFASVTGWGVRSETSENPSQILREVSVQFVSLSECQKLYSRRNVKIFPTAVCAGSTNGGKDACQGDSGGPLVKDGIQYGVVSFGIGCGLPKFPGVYTSVARKQQWIQGVLATI